jgi:hypothetical protein
LGRNELASNEIERGIVLERHHYPNACAIFFCHRILPPFVLTCPALVTPINFAYSSFQPWNALLPALYGAQRPSLHRAMRINFMQG